MSNTYDIEKLCLRYIVPFKYKGSFEDALNRINNHTVPVQTKTCQDYPDKVWEPKTADSNTSESDLYDFIRNEFCYDASDKKLGYQWTFLGKEHRLHNKGVIKELYYFSEELKIANGEDPQSWELPKYIKIRITDMGLFLFRNCFGMLWYEIELPTNKMNSEQLKQFQNNIRELNRNVAYLWEGCNGNPDYGLLEKEIKGHKTYIAPFSLGNWIYETLQFLNVSYLAKRKNANENMIRSTLKKLAKTKYEIRMKEDRFKNNQLTSENADTKTSNSEVPDKAILFTYAVFRSKGHENMLDDKYSYVYHLTNGYKDSYHFSEDIRKDIKRPFANVYWYATQEGVAYLAWPSEEVSEVYKSTIFNKIKTDYFSLFIKLLYQSFSLLIYAEKIQNELSAEYKSYFPEFPKETTQEERITELFGEINLFLTKSMATSVSHIHHQSTFYVYVKKQLRIQDDVTSVTAGLKSLDMLQREQQYKRESLHNKQAEDQEKERDNKMQAIMGVFALLGISSGLTDCFDFITKFNLNDGDFWQLPMFSRHLEGLFIFLIGVISIFAGIFAFKALFSVWKKHKEGDKNKTPVG